MKNMKKIKEDIIKIVNDTIKENDWDRLSSKDYEEYKNVTEIAKDITFDGNPIRKEEVTDVLEEKGYCIRSENKIILTEKGKKYGRYVIVIHLSNNKQIATDKGYAKYKIDVVDIIKNFIAENPTFLLNKREERRQKMQETKKKNKELLQTNKEEPENGKD